MPLLLEKIYAQKEISGEKKILPQKKILQNINKRYYKIYISSKKLEKVCVYQIRIEHYSTD